MAAWKPLRRNELGFRNLTHYRPLVLTAVQRRTPLARQCTVNYEAPVCLQTKAGVRADFFVKPDVVSAVRVCAAFGARREVRVAV
jgi:hypothetical protein